MIRSNAGLNLAKRMTPSYVKDLLSPVDFDHQCSYERCHAVRRLIDRGVKQKDLARCMGLSRSAVFQMYHRARRDLRFNRRSPLERAATLHPFGIVNPTKDPYQDEDER